MKKLMHILFLSCLRASELIEKKFHIKLSVRERIQLRLHKMMCSACTLYDKQSTIIDKGIYSIRPDEISPEKIEHLKTLISQKISDKPSK